MNQLSAEALEVLKRLCAAYAAQPFDEGKEERLRPTKLCRAEQKLAMNELRRAGLLTARHKILGEKLYQIPVEQLLALEQEFFPHQPKFIEGHSVNLSMEAGAGLAVDLFRALQFITREGLPLTAKGIIHKRNLNRLAAQLSFQEKHLLGLTMGTPSDELNVLSATLVVEIMLCLGLITRLKTGYRLNQDMLERWLQLPETRMTDILYGIVIYRCGSIGPADQHFRYLISGKAFVPEKWTALPELLDWMTDLNLTGTVTRDELEQSSLRWLQCLTGFGWCELGCTSEGIQCFRWTAVKPMLMTGSESVPDSETENSNEMFIVQPDFEVLIPPEVSYTVRWILAGCAELLQTDTMWSFRLTREMLVHASERRMPPEEAIAWIRNHARGGLPSVVELSLEQWGKSIGRTSLSEVILLTCQTEEDGAAIAAHPRLQDSLKRIGPLHFLVSPESVEQMRKELFLAGLAPSRMIGGREEEDTDTVWTSFNQEAETEQVLYSLPVLNSELRLLHRGNPF